MYPSRRNLELPTSPINKLPIELLSEIFTLCTQDACRYQNSDDSDSSCPPAISSESVRVPLTLASVNHRWRAIVHGQPSLWTSLCISPELITETYESSSTSRTPTIDLTHIQSCLQRSKQSSLNILIDARDPHWNFAEAGVGLDSGEDIPITTLFSSEHMKLVVAILIPAIARWKSLTILTDTWAPMHSALSIINPALAMYGAPRLESLTLMRCNDFVSFSPQFQPRELKDVGFLTLSYPGSDYPFDVRHLLPRLRHLSLRGVHADWDILGCTLLSSTQNLESLELASHSADVRPSIEQLHNLLTSVSSSLKTMRISGTGPGLSYSTDEPSSSVPLREYASVQLPQLHNIAIGYRSSREGRAILKMLDAPNARKLMLEDATYSGDPEEVNGGSLLTYLGCKEFSSSTAERLSAATHIAVASYDYYSQGHHHYQMSYDAPYLPSSYYDEGDNKEQQQPSCVHRRKSSAASLHCQEPRAAFPLLQHVTLKGVKSSPRALRTFFSALAHLQHLELIEMSMQAVHALVPLSINTSFSSPAESTQTSTCPCPQLRSLCIRDSGHRVEVNDVDLIRYVAVQREIKGACELQELDLHLDPVRAASIAAVTCHSPLSPATKVNIYSDSESDDSDDEDEEEIDPFSPGGAFNDPEFDAYYSTL